MRKRRTIIVLSCIAMMGVFVGLGLRQMRSNLRVPTKQELLTELNQIRPPRDAVTVDETEVVKFNLVLVGKQYSLNATYEDLRKHYDSEFGARGWQFVQERKLKSWGQDHGERDAHYCKQGMSAALFYNANLASQRGFLYGVDLSSGLNDCK